jgi:hypothetical protein
MWRDREKFFALTGASRNMVYFDEMHHFIRISFARREKGVPKFYLLGDKLGT